LAVFILVIGTRQLNVILRQADFAIQNTPTFVIMNENTKQFVLSMLAYAVQRNLSAERLCSACGIDLKKLQRGTHPDLTEKQLDDLWINASYLTKDPLFSLHFGESLQLSALGIVGELIKSSLTVGAAITQACTIVNLITGRFNMNTTVKRKTFLTQFQLSNDKPEQSFVNMQIRDFLMVFTIHELDGLMLKKIEPVSVKLSFQKEYADEYERVLRCKPLKSKECSVEFPIAYWNEPIITANYELQILLLQKINSVATKMKRTNLMDHIQSYLLSNAYLGILSLEEVASNFNMSPRSLQRKLQEEGTAFQEISNTVKKSLAEHYLTTGNYQLKEISDILGYNEPSAFSRAFKRWTGKSPGAF